MQKGFDSVVDNFDSFFQLEHYNQKEFPLIANAVFGSKKDGDLLSQHLAAMDRNVNDVEHSPSYVRYPHSIFSETMIKVGPSALTVTIHKNICLLYTSPSPRDKRQSRMPSSA